MVTQIQHRAGWLVLPLKSGGASFAATLLVSLTGGTPNHVYAWMGLLWGLCHCCRVWCVVCGVACVTAPNFDEPYISLPILFFRKKKKTVLGAGPIRPNPLSFSKSIGGFRP